MGFVKDIFKGIRAYGPASGLLFSRGMWHFMLWPLVVAIVLFWVGGLAVGWLTEWGIGSLTAALEDWTDGAAWVERWGGALGAAVWIVSGVVYYLCFVVFGGYVVLMLLSPVFSWLSEKGENKLTGAEYPFRWREFWWEMWRGILVALRGMVLQFITTVVLMLFSLVPVVGVLGPILIFLAGAYFYGFTFMDYAIERKRLRARDTERFVWRHAGVAVGVGVVFMLAMMLPGIRWFACCFVSLLAVLAGTVVVNDAWRGDAPACGSSRPPVPRP